MSTLHFLSPNFYKLQEHALGKWEEETEINEKQGKTYRKNK